MHTQWVHELLMYYYHNVYLDSPQKNEICRYYTYLKCVHTQDICKKAYELGLSG